MNLLITGAWNDAENYISEIEELGHKVVFMQYEKDALPCNYEWVEGVICNGLFLYHDIKDFVNLRYIQLTSAGYDRVPMDYIMEKGIKIHNATGVYNIPMAEYVIATVLQIYKNMEFFKNNQQAHKWEKNRNLVELFGKKVCIVGCGNIGKACAKLFKVFGCETVGIGQSKRTVEYFDEIFTKEQLVELFETSDVVVLTVPLTEETRNLVNKDVLNKMKKNAILVNISRGAVVDNEALIEKLETKSIYAVLDVFDIEPLSEESKLWDLENVILTPHNSYVGDKNAKRLHDVIINNIIKRENNE